MTFYTKIGWSYFSTNRGQNSSEVCWFSGNLLWLEIYLTNISFFCFMKEVNLVNITTHSWIKSKSKTNLTWMSCEGFQVSQMFARLGFRWLKKVQKFVLCYVLSESRTSRTRVPLSWGSLTPTRCTAILFRSRSCRGQPCHVSWSWSRLNLVFKHPLAPKLTVCLNYRSRSRTPCKLAPTGNARARVVHDQLS